MKKQPDPSDASCVFKWITRMLCRAVTAVGLIAPASWVVAQSTVLELEKSIDGMATWQDVPITSAMLTSDGKLLMGPPGPGNATFFRMNIQITSLGSMVLIPAGTFQMGDSMSPLEGSTDERPLHSVNVSAFHLQNTEVSKAQWDAVRIWGLANGYTDLPAGGGKAANHPVHSLNWYAIVKWCNARSEMEGLTPCYTASRTTYKTGDGADVLCNWTANGYRLPSEAEWEKAARGGLAGKRFPWGDTITHSQANYVSVTSHTYDVSPTRQYHPAYNDGVLPYTAPVGSLPANGYGLFDMTGNLWEWCWDWADDNYYSSSPGTDPRGPASGSNRVFRGGCWINNAPECRAAYRNYDIPTIFGNNIGFRPARNSVP